MSAAAPQPLANMGAPEPRMDGRAKVTGEARYPSDMPVSNPAFAFLVGRRIRGASLAAIFLAVCAVILAWRIVLLYGFHVVAHHRNYMATDTRLDSILFDAQNFSSSLI